MVKTEREVEDLIFSNTYEEIFKNGLCCFTHTEVSRQPNFGSFGFPDFVGYSFINGVHEYTVYEIKLHEVGLHALNQACRYACAIRRHCECKEFDYKINIVLIGDDINHGDFSYMYDFFYITFYVYEINNDNIYFKKLEHCETPQNFTKGKAGILDHSHILKHFII